MKTPVRLFLVALILGVTFGSGYVVGKGARSEPTTRARVRVVGNGQTLFEGVDLTEAQRDSITAIVDRARPRSDSLLSRALPELTGFADSLRQALLQVLTPEQRARLADSAVTPARRP